MFSVMGGRPQPSTAAGGLCSTANRARMVRLGSCPEFTALQHGRLLRLNQETLPYPAEFYGRQDSTCRSANSLHDQSDLRNFSISLR
jgi:hypothetical protein